MAKSEENSEKQYSLAEIVDIIKEMNRGNQDSLIAAVKEMKKPTEAEQKKIDAEEAKLKKQREIRVREMLTEERARKGQQDSCMHKKKLRNGGFGSAWNGQVCSDGYWYPICTVCQKKGPEVKAPIEWLKNGVNAGDMENPIWASLTEETLLEWQRRTGGPKPKVKPMSWTEEEKKEALAV